MGRHSAQPSLGITLRLLMISAAALLTASIASDQGTSHSGRFTASPAPDDDPVSEIGVPAGGQFLPGPVAPAPGDAPAPAETPAHAPASGRGHTPTPPSSHPEPPPPAGPLDSLAAAWTAGTTRGFELLKGVEEAFIEHLPGRS